MTKKVLAVIPARKGSKGIPNKNIYPLLNKPLVNWTIDAAVSSGLFDEIILSSDSEEILQEADKYNIQKHHRDKSLAEDSTKTVDVLLNIVQKKRMFKTLVLLQPTSPLRDANDILSAFNIYSNDKQCDSLLSVVEADKESQKYLNLEGDYLKGIINNEFPSTPRQELPKVYRPNGAIYIIDLETLIKEEKLLTSKSIPYIMDIEKSIDIDSIDDLEKAEKILRDK